MKNLNNLLRKLAITWEEYSKAHPRTKKNPNDPYFSKGKQEPAKQEPKPSDSKPAPAPEQNKAPTKKKPETQKAPARPKTLDEMTDDEVIAKFQPKLKPSQYQKKMSIQDFGKHVMSMSEDDIAWHLLNSDFADDLSGDEHVRLRWAVREHVSVVSQYAMTLLNPHVSKKDKDSTAAWMLDKAGVSFVSSRSLKRFLEICGKKGIISKSVWQEEENSDKDREERDNIAENYTAKQLLKLSPKQIEEHWHYVCQNENLPPEVIKKMIADKECAKGLKAMSVGYMNDSGYMVGMADRKHAIGKAQKLLANKNVPFDVLKDVFAKPFMKMVADGNMKAWEVARFLANREDINKPENKELRDKCVEVFQKQMARVEDAEEREEDEAFPSKYNKFGKKYKPSAPPKTLRMSAEEFKKCWLAREVGTYKHQNEGYFEHPDMPDDVIKAALKKKNGKGEGADFSEVRRLAFKKAMERKLLSDKDLVTAVKTNLNLQGDDVELMRKFAEHAYAAGKGSNDIPRYLTKADEAERKRIEDEMRKTAFHDEFDFEVQAVYTIDNEPHKDFAQRSKELGNIVEGIYHGTSYANAAGILSDGVRVDTEARTGSMFGRGFYLASAASKAAQYAGEAFTQQADDGVVFVLNAALGKTKEMKYGRPFNDEMESRNLQPEDRELQAEYEKKTGKKLKDKWHATHDSVTAKAGQALDYDEYVVKDPSQIQIKRVVIVKKTPKVKNESG